MLHYFYPKDFALLDKNQTNTAIFLNYGGKAEYFSSLTL